MSEQRGAFIFLLVVTAAILGLAPRQMWAGDVKIPLPRPSSPTPVQRLNQEGVAAINKRQYERAASLFYKAYLYDPGDPFTLYNLGYISEREGQLDRAQRFYALASKQATDAVIARSELPELKGKPMRAALNGLHDATMQANRNNVEAIRLLSEGRASEADLLIRKTLAVDPHNAFALNNLGVALEAEGKWEEALIYYAAAAKTHSTATVVVTLNDQGRGQPISELAAKSEKRLRQRMRSGEANPSKAARLALQGVSAVNRNDWTEAERDFRQAYALDPEAAAALNNIGFVAERNGDMETARFFYQRAREAPDANRRATLTTRRGAEGWPIGSLAEDSDQSVSSQMAAENAARRREQGPVQLKRRDGTPITPPSSTAPSKQVPRPPTSPSTGAEKP